jgi:hypothetical protein
VILEDTCHENPKRRVRRTKADVEVAARGLVQRVPLDEDPVLQGGEGPEGPRIPRRPPTRARSERAGPLPFWATLRPPGRFEHGELPLFLLVVIRTLGPRCRLELEHQAFGTNRTPPQKVRVDGAIQTLLAKGQIERQGERRSFVYHLTRAGKTAIRAIPPPTKG